MNTNYPDECFFIKNTLAEVKNILKDLFQTSFMIVPEGDERLEDSFLYCSQRRFQSIDFMDFKELQETFMKEYDWELKKLNE